MIAVTWVSWALLACAPATNDDSSAALSWDNWAHGFFLGYCASCHAASTPDRHGAPISVTFDSESEVRGQAAAIRAAVIEYQTMPIGGGVFPEDLERLQVWLDS